MDSYISKIYNQLTGKTLSDALLLFSQITVTNARTGDMYFEAFGVPNTIELFHAPYERFLCYEYLMHLLKNEDAVKFSDIHKGTPYYFLAWTAFELRNYSRAVFYMDLALGEDIKKSSTTRDALDAPGGNLWKLNPDGPAARIIQELLKVMRETFVGFGNRTGESINMDNFVNNFVLASIEKNVKNRSLISSFFSFIAEQDDLIDTLNIRSQNSSSIEPLLSNLLKGGLIFESLLKMIAEQRDWKISRDRSGSRIGTIPLTLGDFRHCDEFLTLFNINSTDFETRARDLTEIINGAKDNQVGSSFSVTAKLRNTVGHDLRRDDIFYKVDTFKQLADKENNAIMYVIKKIYTQTN